MVELSETMKPHAPCAPRSGAIDRQRSRYEALRIRYLTQGLDAVMQEGAWTSFREFGLSGLSREPSASRLRVECYEAQRPLWGADAFDGECASNLLKIFRRLSNSAISDASVAL